MEKIADVVARLGELAWMKKNAGGRAYVRLLPREGEPVIVHVEVALGPDEQRQGLMYREKLEDGEGMLFPSRFPAPKSFWMKNVPIPLDMIFADPDGRIVHIEHSAPPYSEDPKGTTEPVQNVMEVPGGFCERHGIREGDMLEVLG